MRHREKAICLRTTDFSETSQVAHFFTRGGGVVHLLAKGAKRTKSATGGALDVLSEGELVYILPPSGALGTLVEFAEAVTRSRLRTSAGHLNAALYMAELVGAVLAEADVHVEVFDLLHRALARLNEPDAPASAVLAYFQWRLVRHVGLLGQLRQCATCGRDIEAGDVKAGRVYFDSSAGGILCPVCEAGAGEKLPVTGEAWEGLAVLSAVSAGRRAALPEDQARAVNRLLAYHIRQQLGRPLRMARHAIG